MPAGDPGRLAGKREELALAAEHGPRRLRMDAIAKRAGA